jgi:tRNA (Thr-GGU) A37 N-methylase
LTVRVRQLEAVDGTPIIDLKPILSEDIGRR